MSKLRWGILSTANIGTGKVIPAMQQGQYTEVVAIASRDEARARASADELGIPTAHGSYEALLADPNVDAVYNPLPNHLHVPWSIKAIEAGKHVLCEKPIALTSDEAQQLVDAARAHPDLKVMEAFMYRHHPQWQRAKQIVDEGGIGELRHLHGHFAYFNDNPDNIRNQPEIGGGSLMDVGCYPISVGRFIFGAEPTRAVAVVDYDPEMKVERLSSAILDFGSGNTTTLTSSMQLAGYQRVNIFGSKGRVEIEIPFNAPPDRPCRIWHQHDGQTEEIQFETVDQYTIQGDLFAQAVLNDTPVPTPIEDSVANMRVIEAIVESGKSNGWVEVKQ